MDITIHMPDTQFYAMLKFITQNIKVLSSPTNPKKPKKEKSTKPQENFPGDFGKRSSMEKVAYLMKHNATLDEMAQITGLARSTVIQYRSKIRNRTKSQKPKKSVPKEKAPRISREDLPQSVQEILGKMEAST
jgi:hypothetical protein